jgi:DNA-binding transcriptional MerR regulator
MQDASFKVVSAVAQELRCTESLVRILVRRGVVTPARDGTGRRLFNEDDISRLREHLAKRASKAAA